MGHQDNANKVSIDTTEPWQWPKGISTWWLNAAFTWIQADSRRTMPCGQREKWNLHDCKLLYWYPIVYKEWNTIYKIYFLVSWPFTTFVVAWGRDETSGPKFDGKLFKYFNFGLKKDYYLWHTRLWLGIHDLRLESIGLSNMNFLAFF